MKDKHKAAIKTWLDKQDDPFGCLKSARNVCNIEYLIWFALQDEGLRARVGPDKTPARPSK